MVAKGIEHVVGTWWPRVSSMLWGHGGQGYRACCGDMVASMLWGHIAHLDSEDVSIPSHHLITTWISSGSRWSRRPGDEVANNHEDACTEDTDISLALSAAELLSMNWLNTAASNLEERSCCRCGWSTTSSMDKA